MIDSHTHLDRVPGDAGDVVAAARDAGVNRMLTIGMTPESCRWALQAGERFEGEVFAAVGRHPNSSSGFDQSAAVELEVLAEHPACLAIGETGLDYHWDKVDRTEQARAFALHIEIARRTGKPLIIHTRDAADDTIAMLGTAAQGVEVVMHCFSMPDRLEECLENGWWISFAGNVTYPANGELADAAANVPLDRMLVETDAPYLAPVPYRGRPNTPAWLPLVGEAVANARDCSVSEVAAASVANARLVFRLPDS